MNILSLVSKLPDRVSREICELRMRKGGLLSLSTYTKNLFVTPNGSLTIKAEEGYICEEADIATSMARLTEGSVYRYTNNINSGYVVTRDGIRVGVVGEAVYTKGRVTSVSEFSSLNIRLPHNVESSGDKILGYTKNYPDKSLLIYSPPGYGKTTVIRSVAKGIATGKFATPQRVSVIDERGEILPEGGCGLIDRLTGYSKPDGIEIAVRLLNPEYIVCDEIGLHDDTDAILSVQNTGIPFIATTHGRSLEDILERPNIRKLINHKVFQTFVRLERRDGVCVSVFEELKK